MQTHMGRATFETPLGRCGISWRDPDDALTSFDLPEATPRSDDCPSPPPSIRDIIARVQQHLAGHFQDFSDLPFAWETVASFNAAVLRATLAVKPGETRSYGEIAKAIQQPAAASRAVGAALGANRWPLLIPCHRIVAANGKMTGFSGPGGIKTKLRLLALEGAQFFAE